MNQVYISPRQLAVCLFGNKDKAYDLQACQDLMKTKFNEIEHIEFFSCQDTDDLLFNMYKVSFIKRSYEIEHSQEFDIVLYIDMNKFSMVRFIPNNLELDQDSLYFLRGGFYTYWSSTVIWPEIFYASSMISDFAAKFGQTYNILPKGRKGTCLEEDFYFYLKSLKIKTKALRKNMPQLFEIRQNKVNQV